MLKKTTLAVALSLFALPAFAQTTIGGVPLSAEGLPTVVRYCEDLASMSPSDRFDHRPTHAQSIASGIALRTVSLGDCQRAGLV
ncbi:hypothetical protein [Pelagibacterium luteolum]|uniref:Uncharacterized protein n=1 Tax=Pelagibacterium luteolum TaxID=440168 RepID=A0A1G7S3X6_9HYPH|nr:hypothetical protein [Pelagibacterium luteolum]SDG16820.1 hypothetical protein SAMN04487974_101248 [Pelagibacterium luteolum]